MAEPLDLEAIRARAEKATPGPWRIGEVGDTEEHWVCALDDVTVVLPDLHDCGDCEAEHRGDQEFIAHAREDIPSLLGALAESQAEVERHRAVAETLSRIAFGTPYQLGRYASKINHAEPCDCDEDEEEAGEECLANSDWTYAVFVDGGAFAPRLITTLPREVPEQGDGDCEPDLLADLRAEVERLREALTWIGCTTNDETTVINVSEALS